MFIRHGFLKQLRTDVFPGTARLSSMDCGNWLWNLNICFFPDHIIVSFGKRSKWLKNTGVLIIHMLHTAK